MLTNKKDNEFLYLIKLIASLFVITIHAPFPGFFGDGFGSISRFAVPFFFAVSGRFLFSGSDVLRKGDVPGIRSHMAKKLLKLLKVTAIVYFIHTLFSLTVNMLQGMSIGEWFSMKYNAYEAFIFFLFNSGRFIYDGSYVFDHMWYLFAMIYVYVLIMIFAPLMKRFKTVVMALLLGLLFFGQWLRIYYPIRPFDISIHTPFMLRNWLLFGMPFVLLGVVMGQYLDDHGHKSLGKEPANNAGGFGKPGIIMVAAGMVMSVIEDRIFGSQEIFIGSVVIVIGILLLSEIRPSCGKFLWKLGKMGASNIYFYHVLLIAVLDLLSQNGIIPGYTMWQKPLIVMALSLIIFAIIPFVIKKGYLDEQTAVS
ncbi:MAG: hypothetical protein E7307_02180 [Butyrivibrio sp.]|nr:hypothetical protein [Butyrivibrio sp.]